MAATQAQIDAMKKALYQGASSVAFPDGGSLDYRSVADLERAITRAETELAAASGTAPQMQSLCSYSKD